MLNILYLVHDVYEPAVRRRVLMFQAGGAKVSLAGFRRTSVPGTVAGITPVDLGQTEEGNFTQRVLAVAGAVAKAHQALADVRKPDVIVARNLEMLAVANRALATFGDRAIPLVYECLDVHRLMLRHDAIGASLRATERYLARRTSLFVTSSPAFLREYFEPFGQVKAPVVLVENRHLEIDTAQPENDRVRPAGPWRIGWFGALRCVRSLDLLSRFARQMDGKFEILLRGRPSANAIPDFEARVEAAGHVSFLGPYRNPEDIAPIYHDVHLSWVIDFFEDGQNSKWLLPNRLYEGCRFGAVPIVLAGTESARVVAEAGIGLVLAEGTVDCLAAELGDLAVDRYAALESAVLELGAERWACSRKDCEALVARLAGLHAGSHSHAGLAA